MSDAVEISIAFVLGICIGAVLVIGVVETVDLREQGAIAAHKGEIICVQLAFKEERWECGEP